MCLIPHTWYFVGAGSPSEVEALRRVLESLHAEETVALHEGALDLTDVDGWVQRLAHVHHDVRLQDLRARPAPSQHTGDQS